MAIVCDICGKGVTTGGRIIRRGLAKKKGGIGMHVVKVTTRRFLPNLQKLRVRENGRVLSRRVCTSCIKAGKIQKA
mgnify:CR=1 FL=1